MPEVAENYKVWKIVGDEMTVVEVMKTWKEHAQEKAFFLMSRTGHYHVAVVEGSEYDKHLAAKGYRQQTQR